MSKEFLKIEGHISWKHLRDGKEIAFGERKNVITTAGKNALAALLNSTGVGNSIVTHIGLGTSTTPVNVTDTVLGTELVGGSYARIAVARSNPSANQIQYTATFTGITSNPTVSEAGLLNAITGGTLFAHQLVAPVVQLASASDSLQIIWTITIG